jgi:hypothetical protein
VLSIAAAFDDETRAESALVDDSPATTGPRFTGDVAFADGFNMEVEVDEENNAFIFTAGRGGGLGPLIECAPFDEVPRRLRFINGRQGAPYTLLARTESPSIPPTNFSIKGDRCVEILHYPDLNMIVLNDHCKGCDCERLVDLDDRITALGG